MAIQKVALTPTEKATQEIKKTKKIQEELSNKVNYVEDQTTAIKNRVNKVVTRWDILWCTIAVITSIAAGTLVTMWMRAGYYAQEQWGFGAIVMYSIALVILIIIAVGGLFYLVTRIMVDKPTLQYP